MKTKTIIKPTIKLTTDSGRVMMFYVLDFARTYQAMLGGVITLAAKG